MTIFSRFLKRFSYLILSCFFCCLPAFANFFTTDDYTLSSSVTKEVNFADKTPAFGAIATFAGVPPEASNVKNFYLQSINQPFQILPLIGKDSDGSIVSFKIITRTPANPQGRLMLNNVQVTDGQTISLSEAKMLKFEPRTGFTGDASFTYSVTDNEGLTDATPATYTIPVTANASMLVCSGTGLGTNILGAKGTFSAPYITPNTSVNNCINNGSSTAAPLGNLGIPKPLQTSYSYASTSGGLGPEGTYSFLKTLGTIDPANRNCIKTDWVASDHTGDGGYAMIVNGSPDTTKYGKTFYKALSQPVCPNTLYEFSAYVINVLPKGHSAAQAGTEPNISFYINGQLVSRSGPIAYANTPQWVKVGGLWYSGPNTTSVELRIDNATVVASGNDLGLDDISMAICGPDISYPDIDLTAKFCSYGVLPLKADVKASINTYSAYIFQNSVDGGTTWTDMGTPKIGSPVYNAGLNTYEYLAEYGDIPITPSMDGYRYRLKVATDVNNLTGTNCNVSADKIITVSTFNVPAGGADIIGCNPSLTAKLVAAGSGESWSIVAGNPAAATIDQSGNIAGMTANGIYKFQLTNTAGCSDTVNVVRDEVKSAGADVKVCAPETTLKLADAGTGYKWEAVAGNPASAAINPTTGQVSGLNADGIYHFILRSDFGGCTDEILVTKSSISLTSSKTDVLCFGASTGSVNLSVTGGTAPYTYAWTGGITTEDLAGLAAGTYNVTVTDANNCTATASVIITEPGAALALTSSKTDVLCFGSATGLINLNITGGFAPYTISWDNGKSTQDLTNLVAGAYTATVTDSKGCTVKSTIIITQPVALEVTASKLNVSCYGLNTGAISLNVRGGTAPFTYKWSSGQSTKDMTGIPSGTYKVIVTDAGKCSVSAEVIITQPEPLIATLTVKNAGCLDTGGAISSKIIGGVMPYTITWAGNSTLTASEINNAKAGIYEMVVTDAAGCTVSVKAEVKQSVCAPLAQNDIFDVEQNKVLVGDVAPNDINSQPDKLTFTKLTDPKNGKITFESNGSFTFVPDNGFAGKVEFNYQICNSTGGCDTAKVSLDIKALVIVNLTPELSSVREGRKISVTARLTQPFHEDVIINVEYSGKAEKERDYLVLDQYMSLKIPKGSLSTTEKMTFAALNDGFQEGDEDIIVKIRTVSNPNVTIGNGAVVIINDVYPPPPPTDEPQDEPINAEIVPDALMSPNGDGNGNEAFKIQNIEFYPDNEVLIFNRWGNALFAIKNYNNSDRNFKGYANKGLLVNSDLPLSDGVYFYMVTTYRTAGTDKTKQVNKGYLILKR